MFDHNERIKKMDNFRIIDGLSTIVLGALSWFLKETHNNHKELSKEVSDFKYSVAKEYIPNERFEITVKAMADDIRYIRDKLDNVK